MNEKILVDTGVWIDYLHGHSSVIKLRTLLEENSACTHTWKKGIIVYTYTHMVDLKELQKEVMRNKIEKGFNTTDIASEFCRAYEELSEAFSKHNKNQPGVAEEFADVTIFLLGMSEILGFDLEKELVRKIEINKNRKYKKEKSPDGKDIFLRIRTPEDP
jgi:NTP pyrophosphatase (non-canonical NTP hydrolase)